MWRRGSDEVTRMAVKVAAVDDGSGARMGCEGVVMRVEVMDDDDDGGSIVGVWRLWKAAFGRSRRRASRKI
ncbi:hypothetical protein Tco_0414729 [Tanacetum coccineum]